MLNRIREAGQIVVSRYVELFRRGGADVFCTQRDDDAPLSMISRGTPLTGYVMGSGDIAP